MHILPALMFFLGEILEDRFFLGLVTIRTDGMYALPAIDEEVGEKELSDARRLNVKS